MGESKKPESRSSSRPSRVEQSFFSTPDLGFLEIRTTLGSSTPYATHFHQAFSIGVILAGGTVFTCKGEECAVTAGDLVLIEAGSPHSCNPLAGRPRSYHMLYLNQDWCLKQAGFESSVAVDATLLPKQRVLRDERLYRELVGLIERLRGGDTRAAQDFGAMLGRLLREHCAAGEPSGRISGALDGDFATEPGRLKVAETARFSGCSRENFIRSFRRKTGMTPGSYNHAARLEAARRMLRAGAGIAETALAVGYADQSHFHRMFVKYFAATPRQYRRGGGRKSF